MIFFIKQLVKMLCQQIYLPAVYRRNTGKPVIRHSVLLADAHHEEIPFSMRAMKQALTQEPEVILYEMYWNNDKCSFGELLRHMTAFMKLYATVETVIICDNFLPAASCRKRKETMVVQLWHACGAYKKFGYDTETDIPAYYKGNVMANCNLVTVSAPVCVKPFSSAMRIPQQNVRPLGISRTDLYYDQDYNRSCRERFFREYPEAAGKKVVLWAPTFRGNPGVAGVQGLTEIQEAAKSLSDTHYFIIKLHPHTQLHVGGTNCSILTEELLPAVDVLITDYSSVIFDAMVYRMPLVLFVPDYADYADNRGFYLDFGTIPGIRAENLSELMCALMDEQRLQVSVDAAYDRFYDTCMSGCDGQATIRIIQAIRHKD